MHKWSHVMSIRSILEHRSVSKRLLLTEGACLVCLQSLSFLSFSLFFSKVYNLVQLIMI